jgi:hypothetical protein
MESMMMEDTEIALMFSMLAIPLAIWLQLWVKGRRIKRRNELGAEEFEGTGSAFASIVVEGSAIIGGLMLVILGVSGIIKYIVTFYS